MMDIYDRTVPCFISVITKKQFFLLLGMMLAFIPTFSWAETVEIGGICYELSVEWRTAEVTTRDVKYSGDIKIPETVYDDATGIFYDVTSISDGAFQGCSITSISLPSNLTSIGDRAFASTSLVYI